MGYKKIKEKSLGYSMLNNINQKEIDIERKPN